MGSTRGSRQSGARRWLNSPLIFGFLEGVALTVTRSPESKPRGSRKNRGEGFLLLGSLLRTI